MTNNGAALMPRMLMLLSFAELGSPVACITCKPATCPVRALSMLTVGIISKSSCLMVSTEPVRADFFCMP